MHITGDLSLRRLRHADQAATTVRATPSSPTTCTRPYPGTKFITVGEKSYAVESATGATGDIARAPVEPRRHRPLRCPTRLPQPDVPAAGTGFRDRHGKPCRRYLQPTPTVLRALLHQLRQRQRLRHHDRVPVLDVPRGRQPLLPRQRRLGDRHLGGDTWVADAAIDDDGEASPGRGCSSRMGAIDKAAHMWGAQDDAATAGRAHCIDAAARPDPRAVRRRERRRPARQDPRRDQGASTPARAARPWSC